MQSKTDKELDALLKEIELELWENDLLQELESVSKNWDKRDLLNKTDMQMVSKEAYTPIPERFEELTPLQKIELNLEELDRNLIKIPSTSPQSDLAFTPENAPIVSELWPALLGVMNGFEDNVNEKCQQLVDTYGFINFQTAFDQIRADLKVKTERAEAINRFIMKQISSTFTVLAKEDAKHYADTILQLIEKDDVFFHTQALERDNKKWAKEVKKIESNDKLSESEKTAKIANINDTDSTGLDYLQAMLNKPTLKNFNKMTDFVIEDILAKTSEKERIVAIERYVLIAQDMLKEKNIDTAMTIIKALNDYSIQRMEKTLGGLPKEIQAYMEDYRQLADEKENFKNLREYCNQGNEAGTTYLPLYIAKEEILDITDIANKKHNKFISQIEKMKKENPKNSLAFCAAQLPGMEEIIEHCKKASATANLSNEKRNDKLIKEIDNVEKKLNLENIYHHQAQVTYRRESRSKEIEPAVKPVPNEKKQGMTEKIAAHIKSTINNLKSKINQNENTPIELKQKILAEIQSLKSNMSTFFEKRTLAALPPMEELLETYNSNMGQFNEALTELKGQEVVALKGTLLSEGISSSVHLMKDNNLLNPEKLFYINETLKNSTIILKNIAANPDNPNFKKDPIDNLYNLSSKISKHDNLKQVVHNLHHFVLSALVSLHLVKRAPAKDIDTIINNLHNNIAEPINEFADMTHKYKQNVSKTKETQVEEPQNDDIRDNSSRMH